MTVVGRHPVHAGKRHGAVALDPKVNGRPVENRLVLTGGDEGGWRFVRAQSCCLSLLGMIVGLVAIAQPFIGNP